MQPPRPKEHNFHHRHHGIIREDPWHWMRDRENPEVIAHLVAENAYTGTVMRPAADLADQLYRELVGRIEESNLSAPYPDGRYIYQSRIDKGQDYRTYWRMPRGGGDWELYYDANREARGHSYFDIGFLDVSPNGRWLAHAADTTGDERYILRFRDLDTGRDLPAIIRHVSPEGEWDASSGRYFFVKEDRSRRPYRIFRYTLDEDPADSALVYEETDPLFDAGIYKSQDSCYIFAVSESKETTEVAWLPAADPEAPFRTFQPRRTGIKYWLEHRGGRWLIRTNEGATDYRLLSVPVGQDGTREAEVLIPARDGLRLEDVIPLRDHLLLLERRDGLDQVRVIGPDGGEGHLIALPDPVYDLQPTANADYDTEYFQFAWSSPIRPLRTIRYNLRTREQEILRESVVPSGHNPDNYAVYRIEARSRDGTAIPLTVLHRKDIRRDGTNPAYLYGYGAYGNFVECGFRTSWLTWLERGFVVAIAHVRGGGLLGEHWYQEGKLEKKENSFQDFIACGETLVQQGYTRPERLVIEGGSAGGLLVGAVLNLRPDLFKAIVAAVPFVDVVNTMLDPSLPLTTVEYEEWGNPGERASFEKMLAYSPYDNVRRTQYPAVLVTAGLYDARVPYWEAAKWVAKLRKHQTGEAPILLKTHLEAGHEGLSARYDYWRDVAVEQAFLLWQLGMTGDVPAMGVPSSRETTPPDFPA